MAHRQSRVRGATRGFTVVELLLIIALIMVLMALLLPALNAVRTQARMATSMNNMRQIGTYVQSYASDHRDYVLPSQFDYYEMNEAGSYVGRAAAPVDYAGNSVNFADREPSRHRGTWADTIWTIYELGRFPILHNDQVQILPHAYSRAAPDRALYDEVDPSWDGNILRSAATNSRDANPDGDGVRLPYGDGAHERGYPGFFAANNFFDSRQAAEGGWYTFGQIRAPSRSMYLVDSYYGEIIEDEPAPWDNTGDEPTIQVDFRYAGVALFMRMDWSVEPESRWLDICEVEVDRGIRIRNLTQRGVHPDCAN